MRLPDVVKENTRDQKELMQEKRENTYINTYIQYKVIE